MMDWQCTIEIAAALIVVLVALQFYRRQRRSRLLERDAETRAQQSSALQAAATEAPASVTPTGKLRSVALIKRLRSTRNPIVLAHGWGGIEHLVPEQLGYRYFRGIPEMLRLRGHAVHVAYVPPTASIDLRAQQLAIQIKQLDCQVNIIAHSMGGLDARLAIARYGLDEHVASLTTIGTPHHGTPLADAALVFGEWRRARKFLGHVGLNVDGLYDVSTARMREFNAEVPNAPGVFYSNIIAAADHKVGGVHAMLAAGHRYLLRTAGPNDGVVPARSQLWGETLEEIDADHWAQIGWFSRFDVHGMYARIAQKLSNLDF
jgi:triacylglycerol lipase